MRGKGALWERGRGCERGRVLREIERCYGGKGLKGERREGRKRTTREKIESKRKS